MWKHMARIIGEVRPQYVFVENSPMLTTRGLGVVLADLSKMGFDAKWGVISAADIGANHQRERIWIRAKQRDVFSHSEHNGHRRREQQSESTQEAIGMADTNITFGKRNGSAFRIQTRHSINNFTNLYTKSANSEWWQIEPKLDRVVDGVAARVDRLKAIGNGQVPLCAATAWELLK